jgi:hypothetical protein
MAKIKPVKTPTKLKFFWGMLRKLLSKDDLYKMTTYTDVIAEEDLYTQMKKIINQQYKKNTL